MPVLNHSILGLLLAASASAHSAPVTTAPLTVDELTLFNIVFGILCALLGYAVWRIGKDNKQLKEQNQREAEDETKYGALPLSKRERKRRRTIIAAQHNAKQQPIP